MERINFECGITALRDTAVTLELKTATEVFAAKYYDAEGHPDMSPEGRKAPDAVHEFADAVEHTGDDYEDSEEAYKLMYFTRIREAADEALKSPTGDFNHALVRFRNAARGVENEILADALHRLAKSHKDEVHKSVERAYKRMYRR